MQRIIINEVDETTNETTNSVSDVVYIPGFATKGPSRVPTLCTSIGEFYSIFGNSPATFVVDQIYPKYVSGSSFGFSADAIPSDATPWYADSTSEISGYYWFESGDKDPSFIYAEELLSAGLSIVYEKINMNNDKPEVAASLYSVVNTYDVGDIVAYDDSCYECISEITEGEAWNPEHWTLCDIGGHTYPEYEESGVSYKVGDRVSVSVTSGTATTTSYYVCLEAITAPAGAFDNTKWEEIEPDFDISEYDVTVTRMYQALTGEGLDDEKEKSVYYVSEDPDTHVVDYTDSGTLAEISTYDIKYLTSGGYPSFEFYTQEAKTLAGMMSLLARTRGDAIAFIDHTDSRQRALLGAGSVYEAFKTSIKDSFTTMITPWAIYNGSIYSDIHMPGSFGYFLALARTLRTYPSWLPIAGVVRGLIPQIVELNTEKRLTNAVADAFQTVTTDTENSSINGITYINGQGFTLWGNRTSAIYSKDHGFATMFLNMRNLVCDVKKQAFKSAQKYMFEQNTDILWLNFKNDIQKLLDQMVSGTVVKNYKIIRIANTNKTKIAAKIQIIPIYAVEEFEISVILTDDEITVE